MPRKKAKAPTDKEAFKYAVLEPLKVKVKVKNPDKLLEIWADAFVRFDFLSQPDDDLPPLKTLTGLQKDLKQWIRKVENSPLANDMTALILEMMASFYVLGMWIEVKKQTPKASSTYPRGLLLVTRSIIKFWETATHSKKKINAYTPGAKHELVEENIKPSKNPKLKSIDHKHNSGGAFIQRVLSTYYNKQFNNVQIQTLLDKCYSIVFMSRPKNLPTQTKELEEFFTKKYLPFHEGFGKEIRLFKDKAKQKKMFNK